MPEEPQKFSFRESAIITTSVERSKKLIDEKLKQINWLMGGVIIVLFVSVLTMLVAVGGVLWEAITFRASTYGDLVTEVRTQRSQIETLNKAILDMQQVPEYKSQISF
jgi:hypothetical protein